MEKPLPRAIIPASTYRLQFNKYFGFKAATEIISYLDDLGISHLYASPYMRTRPGSLHGYDIVDHSSLNPEVGSEEEFDALLAALRDHGMGQLLDIVPNHMCVDCSDNGWWQDVLENGPAAVHAPYFDINWFPTKRELTNKVLLPVLGAQFGTVLESGELRLSYREEGFYINYYEHYFPVCPNSYPFILSLNLEQLEQSTSEQQVVFDELRSIITGFSNLPDQTDVEAHQAERYREKEVNKRRLWRHYQENQAIREFVDRKIESINGIPGDPASFQLMERLLLDQSYRVAHWRVATEEINYRRFFDINALGALRIELEQVFNEVHRLILELVQRGEVTGLRVDHSDGLYNPVKYFHQLQYACYQRVMGGPEASPEQQQESAQRYQLKIEEDPNFKPFYIIGEKILLGSETVHREWSIFGETGYSFLNQLNHFSVDLSARESFDSFYREFAGVDLKFKEVLYQKKKLVMYSSLSSEINNLGYRLSELAEKHRHTRDFTLNSLVKTMVEVIAHFPVYRTYTNSLVVGEIDRSHIDFAVDRARHRNIGIDSSVFDFVQSVLTLNFFEGLEDEHKAEWLDFVMRFQQITGPIMAKGMEDTTFYIYNRLISLNEVGGGPERFGMSVADFHAQNADRAENIPHALLASTTHDTKRSEDTRTRINVLSEIPEEWVGAVARWTKAARRHKKLVENEIIPTPNEEYHFYQTLVGAWPIEGEDPGLFPAFTQRVRDYMLKALREAKENTSWINPNDSYEQTVLEFVDAMLADRTFLDDFKMFQKQVTVAAMYSSLSLTLLKMTSPGIPDFYQGSELWDLRLVDPDNRQPVDYEARRQMLQGIRALVKHDGAAEAAGKFLDEMDDGRVKLFLVWRVLTFRKMHQELFQYGNYLPIEASNGCMNNVCAFARRHGNEEIIVVAPRFFSRLTASGKRKPVGTEVWEDCHLSLPEDAGTEYKNLFTDELLNVEENALKIGTILGSFPVALLLRTGAAAAKKRRKK